ACICEEYDGEGHVAWDETAQRNAEFIAMANPANILALVEALEKAQQQMTESENRVRKQNRHICELFDDNTALRKRIAELESRTVTVKLASRRLPSDYVDGEFGNDDLAAIHNACRLECKVSVEKYLSAHGIVVKWEDE
ncbi:ead/Ea22-like family protein, partial [Klebsiella pneumoniae]|nr:ead/Ea22-like family protein [Klebsiella pneumoniae]